MNIVKDMRTLKAMQKRGFVTFCNQTGSKIHGLYSSNMFVCYYVDSAKSHFVYNGKTYTEKYFDGCFFPFVVEVE
jgi:hypothetical protein